MRKRLRAVVAAALCLIIALFAFSGCGGGGSALSSKNPVTVTLWHYYVGDNLVALERMVAEFNTTVGMEKGVVVEPLAMGSIAELEEKVEASAKGVVNSEEMPHLFSCYPDVAYKIDKLDKLAELGQYFSEEEIAAYEPGFIADGIFAGDRLMVVPVVKSTELLYVNETEWRAFCDATGHGDGDLATWEGVMATAADFYGWSGGKGLMGFDNVANFVLLGNRQQGVELLRQTAEGGEVVLNEAAMREVFDVYFNSHVLGHMVAEGKFRSDDMKQDALIAYVGSSSGAAYFPTEVTSGNEQTPIDFLPLPYPVFEGGERYAIQQGAGMSVAKSDAAHEAGASVFLKWFTQPAQNISFAMTTGYLPVQTAAFDDPLFASTRESMRGEGGNGENVAEVYDVVLEQVGSGGTYAAKPFEGAYDARTILQDTLVAVTAGGTAESAQLRAEGMDDTAILEALDTDAFFAQWLEEIRAELDKAELRYVEG